MTEEKLGSELPLDAMQNSAVYCSTRVPPCSLTGFIDNKDAFLKISELSKLLLGWYDSKHTSPGGW